MIKWSKPRIVSVIVSCGLAAAQVFTLIPWVVPTPCSAHWCAPDDRSSRNRCKDDIPPFPVGGKLSHVVQKYTGVNRVSSVLAGRIAGALIRHKLKGKAKVKVRLYNFTDLVAGKVKSFDVRLKDSEVEGLDLPEVHVTTKCPVWYSPFKGKDKKRGLNNPVLLSVEGKLHEADVVEALKKQEITRALSVMKLEIPGLGGQELEVLDPDVAIKKNFVEIKGVLVTRGAKEETGLPITISATPNLVANDKVFLENLKVESPYIIDPEAFAKFISDLLNPIVRFSRYDRNTHTFRLMTLDVSDDSVYGAGNLLLVPKDYKPHVAKGEPSM